ncbi:pyrimidine 5'-nucleotidase [Vibrio sp. SCSIO 43136]|uniref:pyrimidine 5'-nucleotidase n=1 Tax=Vibrio sp. SCSIO 43136 TaxID=2819101 RepID=UPI0020766648|nr:pyrimidine 5'-nucleotidase [Vibrio sp. SCSIO 43136]USD67874.1 pyrimidine 5'-nucleotidase [Vibrio sp. SCSIO 43136]
MKYDWILFDADETLFSFDAYLGLKTMFSTFGVDFSTQDFATYQQVNKPLWVKYQDGEISASQLQSDRFLDWAKRLNTSAHDLNQKFLDAMADICQPLPGVVEMLEYTSQHAKLGIITNGFTQLQQVRLNRTGLSDYFEHVVISEEVGLAKPAVGIFDYALEKMGQPERSKVLMIGDNIHSDVLGGLNAGIDTCWLNLEKQPQPTEITPHYELHHWGDFERVIR